MTEQQTVSILSSLRVAYPYFYRNITPNDIALTVRAWQEVFQNEPFELVEIAVKNLLETHTDYPPNIGHIKQKMREITATATDEPTNEDLWLKLKRAAENGLYGAKEEFEKLPPILQRFLGSPGQLRDYAMMDSERFNTVTKGQFLKQIEVERERERYRKSIPPATLELLRTVAAGMALPESASVDHETRMEQVYRATGDWWEKST